MTEIYTLIDNVLVVKGSNFSCFFDPESLFIFSKEDPSKSNEEVIREYKNNNAPSCPKENINLSDSSHIRIELHVTDRCNLRCQYCYISKECQKETSEEMSEEIIEKALICAKKAFPNARSIHLSLFGGEPMLFWKKFTFLTKKTKDIFPTQAIKISFPTNGTIINRKILSLLKEHNISFQLSMDGTRQEQDFLRPTKEGKKSFDAILKNIKLFQEAQKTLSVRATITPYNMQLSKMFLFFKKIGFKRMNFNLCSSSDSDWLIRGKNIVTFLQEWDLLADYYLKHLIEDVEIIQLRPFQNFFIALYWGKKNISYCSAGKTLFAISPKGHIYLCHRFIGNKNYQIGDVDAGFDESSLLRKNVLGFHIKNEKKCENCFAKYVCGGGCHHEKSTPVLDTSCKVTRHLFYRAIQIYCELLINHPKAFQKTIENLHIKKTVSR